MWKNDEKITKYSSKFQMLPQPKRKANHELQNFLTNPNSFAVGGIPGVMTVEVLHLDDQRIKTPVFGKTRAAELEVLICRAILQTI